eukprot:scaffold18600_cov20-Tisochrysis_lutea.AAC.2
MPYPSSNPSRNAAVRGARQWPPTAPSRHTHPASTTGVCGKVGGAGAYVGVGVTCRVQSGIGVLLERPSELLAFTYSTFQIHRIHHRRAH